MQFIVKDSLIKTAKKQIDNFKKIKEGKWRYSNV